MGGKSSKPSFTAVDEESFCVCLTAISYERVGVSDYLSDIAISVSECAERWPAHKLVLAAGSEVFGRMFQSNMREVQEGRIIISDVDPEAVKQMLEYLYKGCCSKLEGLTSGILVDLIKLAHLYEIEGLKVQIVSKMLGIITVENAPEIFTIAELHGQSCIMEKALSVAKSNRESVFKNQAHFKELVETFPNFMFQLFKNSGRKSAVFRD